MDVHPDFLLCIQDVHFVHPDIRCVYSSDSRVRQQLRVRRFATPELLHWARKVCETGILQELGMPWLAELLVCVFHNLAELQDQERVRMLASLRRLPILPLMDGSTASMCGGNGSISSGGKETGSAMQPAHAEPASNAEHGQQQQQQQQQQAPRPVFFPLQCSVQAMKARAAVSGVTAKAADEAGKAASADTAVDSASDMAGPESEDVPVELGRAQQKNPAAKATAVIRSGAGKSSSTTTNAKGSADASIKCTRAEKQLLDVGLDWSQMELQQLHPDLFQVEHGKAQKLRNGLAELGVRDLSHADVLQLHVLPLFRRYKERLNLAQQEQQQEQQLPQQEGCGGHGAQAKACSVSDFEARQLAAALTYLVASGLMQRSVVVLDKARWQERLAASVHVGPAVSGDHHAAQPPLFAAIPTPAAASSPASYVASSAAATSCTAAAPHHSECATRSSSAQTACAQVQDAACPEFAQLLASLTAALHGPPVKGTPPLQQFRHLARIMEGLWHAAGYAACMSVPATPLTALPHAVQQQQQQQQQVALDAGAAAAAGDSADSFASTAASSKTHDLSPSPVLVAPGTAAAAAPAANADVGNCAATAASSEWDGPHHVMHVPSAFALALRNSAWLLSSADEPAKPTNLFWQPAYKNFLASKVPYVRHDTVQSREVLSDLGVHMQLTLRESLGLLIEWATGGSSSHHVGSSGNDGPVRGAGTSSARLIKGPDGTVINCNSSANPALPVLEGNCFRTSLHQMGTLYAFIARQAQEGQDVQAVQAAQAEIVAAFSKHPLLWLPPKLAEKPRAEAEVDGSFVSTACARHLDKAHVMEAIPWARQHLRILGRYYSDASQALFLTPLWRPKTSSGNSAAAGNAAGQESAAVTESASPMGAADIAGGRGDFADGTGADGGMDMDDVADGMDTTSEAGSEHGDNEDGGDGSASDSSDQGDDDNHAGFAGSAAALGENGTLQQQRLEDEGCKFDADCLIKQRPTIQEYADALVALAESCPDEMTFETARSWVMKLFQWIESLPSASKKEMLQLLAPHIYINSSLTAPRVFPTTRGHWASLQVMWQSAAEAEAAARRDGLMREYNPSELQEVLQGLEHLPDAGSIGSTHNTPEYLLAEQECYRPFDILVTDAAGNETFVEVKSTRAHQKNAFSVSREELSWAHEVGYAYHIYRVTGAGTPNCRFECVINPVKLWTDKAIRMCLVL
ncbi:hypothetical protein DUNSADRAFT_9907 [Dunaliella salina]|uniref:Protein NO VEIN C-terminal domain-containing protein n=1 Tax=Dunaliella salina TaxID=3046 RepID=A0ABQ7GGH4_DUNSA|nr:hypothetical protein DUNSADRAFT_9907 [Dunaliella salina]|eukprot:KAF5833709.1 hypothetical protein DUNSADRAFT_9907 [Dunaliella salina]